MVKCRFHPLTNHHRKNVAFASIKVKKRIEFFSAKSFVPFACDSSADFKKSLRSSIVSKIA